MDRTVPKTGSEEIELYMRTYYSLLRSTQPIQLETLVESHLAIDSSLHIKARLPEPDVATLVYCSLRIPACMPDVNYVLIGQIEKSFVEAGYSNVAQWERVFAPGRRRRVHYDGNRTLAVFIASRSDIDDLVPILTAYQIEWNKLHMLLQGEVTKLFLAQHHARKTPLTGSELDLLAAALRMETDELRRLEIVWGERFISNLDKIAQARKHISIRQLAGSLAAYRRAMATWWRELQEQVSSEGADPEQRHVYFVSSNTHSLVNLLVGFARREESNLIGYIESAKHADLLTEYRTIQEETIANLDNFLYYVLKKYLADNGQRPRDQLAADEQEIGIHRVPNKHGFEIEAQVIEISKLREDWLDPRLGGDDDYHLFAKSDALIVNIDYPLGLAAFDILNRVTERVGNLLGVYVMGKAATLNGRVGDVMISNVVHDEHSQNTYLFNNCFSAQNVAPYMAYGMVLDNQKAISAPGTFLQNPRYMSVFYQEGYTVIEMETGPYLSSIYEAVRPNRHPHNEIVTLHSAQFDVGVLHYASDTPMGRGHNLGAGNLSYMGIDPTYASAVAILRRIFNQEAERLRRQIGIETVMPVM
jgi:hypothetical protein